jgi:hypothetical protein
VTVGAARLGVVSDTLQSQRGLTRSNDLSSTTLEYDVVALKKRLPDECAAVTYFSGGVVATLTSFGYSLLRGCESKTS